MSLVVPLSRCRLYVIMRCISKQPELSIDAFADDLGGKRVSNFLDRDSSASTRINCRAAHRFSWVSQSACLCYRPYLTKCTYNRGQTSYFRDRLKLTCADRAQILVTIKNLL